MKAAIASAIAERGPRRRPYATCDPAAEYPGLSVHMAALVYLTGDSPIKTMSDIYFDAGEHRLIIRAGLPRVVSYSDDSYRRSRPERRELALRDARAKRARLHDALMEVEEWIHLAEAGAWQEGK